MKEPEYQAMVNGMVEHYVGMMQSKDYQVVGRNLDVSGLNDSLGVMRVDFNERRIYAEDIDDGQMHNIVKRELVASEFCSAALMELADYSCDAIVSVPLANIEEVEQLGYDLYFQDAEVMNSTEAEIFFEELFGVDNIEEEFEVRFLS
jgi:hypothetical protein